MLLRPLPRNRVGEKDGSCITNINSARRRNWSFGHGGLQADWWVLRDAQHQRYPSWENGARWSTDSTFHTPNGIHMRSLKPRTSTLALQKEIEAVGIQDIRSHEFKYAFWPEEKPKCCVFRTETSWRTSCSVHFNKFVSELRKGLSDDEQRECFLK